MALHKNHQQHKFSIANHSYIAGVALVEFVIFCKVFYTVQSTELEMFTHIFSVEVHTTV